MEVRVDSWAWLSKDTLTPEQIVNLKERLTVIPIKTSEEQKEDPEPIPLYIDNGSHLGIPRQYFFDHKRPVHEVVLETTKGSEDWWPAEFVGTLRPEQKVALDYVVAQLQGGRLGGIIQAKPGWGKCLGLGTPVLRYDGQILAVEDVQKRDLLMGPDGAPREVLSTTRGRGPLYRIVPKVGAPWVCNEDHILTLVHSLTGEVRDVALMDYLKLPAKDKHYLKQFSPEHGIDFNQVACQRARTTAEWRRPLLPVDPYFMGMWFGDGTKALNGVAISKPDPEVKALCEDIAGVYGLRVRTDTSGSCPTYHLVSDDTNNPLLNVMRELVGDAEAIPHAYLTADRESRRAFLAGFLDADGHNNNGCLRVVQKRRAYADGVAFIARSLGIRATIRPKPVDGRVYWRVNMAGDFSDLPMRIARKYPGPRKQRKIATRTGFDVEYIGEGEYAGFTLRGDGRFLLGDFTVTHNTVVALAIAAELGVPTLVVVHKEFLMDQWQQRIAEFLPAAQIGHVQQDTCDFRGKTIVMGMVHSLGSNQSYPDDLWTWPGLIIVDETHRIGARTWAPVPPRFKAHWRLGFTATPRRKDGADDVFWQHLGPVLMAAKEERLKPLIKRVWSKFKLVKTDRFNPNLAPRSRLITFLCASRHRNDLIVDQVTRALEAGRKCIVLSERLVHLERLELLLQKRWSSWAGGDPSIGWYVGGRKKHQLEEAATKRVVLATVQYAAEGLDIPALDTLFLTTPMSDVEQAVGRILRPYQGKKEPIVVDFRDDSIPMFEAMGRKRDRQYQRIA